jgi:2-C-methyl-D-erythritol 4-phosphate cytidylyltransferase
MTAAVVIAAGGAGRRMGDRRKQFMELAGQPLLLRALRVFLDQPVFRWAIVALPAEELADPPSWLTALAPRVQLVAGGRERGDSVARALDAVPPEAELVLVHDAARPLVSRAVIERVLAGAARGGAIAAIPAADTIKEVDPTTGRILATPQRSRLWHAQTPQGFPAALLREIYRRAAADGVQATDDAALAEHYGFPVEAVLGAPENLKITTAEDLDLALCFLDRARRS